MPILLRRSRGPLGAATFIVRAIWILRRATQQCKFHNLTQSVYLALDQVFNWALSSREPAILPTTYGTVRVAPLSDAKPHNRLISVRRQWALACLCARRRRRGTRTIALAGTRSARRRMRGCVCRTHKYTHQLTLGGICKYEELFPRHLQIAAYLIRLINACTRTDVFLKL